MKYTAVALLIASAKAVSDNQDRLYDFVQHMDDNMVVKPEEIDVSALYHARVKPIDKQSFSELLDNAEHPDGVNAQQSMQNNQEKLWEAIQLDSTQQFIDEDQTLSKAESEQLTKEAAYPSGFSEFVGRKPVEAYSFSEGLAAMQKFDGSDVQLRFIEDELSAQEKDSVIMDVVPQEMVIHQHKKVNMEKLMQSPPENYESMSLSQSLDALKNLE